MKETFRKILFVIALVLVLILGSCMSFDTMAEQSFWRNDLSNNYCTSILIDDLTGVNYILITTGNGLTLAPRYRTDGTLYTNR